jgi:CheY-like chemotaxis protein
MTFPTRSSARIEAALETEKPKGFGTKPEPDRQDAMQKKSMARILIVDDDASIPRAIVRGIGPGFSSTIFGNPEEALQSYKSAGADLVVSDYNMNSSMTGLVLLKAVREHNPAARVIVLSGGLKSSQKEELLTAGARYVLPKPFELAILKLAITNALNDLHAKSSRILVVDDSENTSKALAEMFREEGHETETAENGLDGYAKYCSGSFGLVISDYRMPDMDGLELLRIIRQGNPNAKVVMMSADFQHEDMRVLQAEGAFALLKKPLEIEELKVVLDGALG